MIFLANKMELYSTLILSIFLVPTNCLLLSRWKYKTKLGRIEYCCRCSKDFVKEDVIKECFLKNKHNHYLLPFCNCYQGFIPKCPKTVTICNQNVVCPNNTVYNKCQIPFLKNATLTCNDTLQWDPSFQCPKVNQSKFSPKEQECPHNVSVCEKNIQPNKTAVGTKFEESLFGHRIHFKCQNNFEWQYDYQCPNGKVSKAKRNIIVITCLGVFVPLLLVLLAIICCCKSHTKKGSPILQYFKAVVGKCISCNCPRKREVPDVTNGEQNELFVLLERSVTRGNDTSTVEEQRQLSCTDHISNINNENTCEVDQLRELGGPANESKRNNDKDSGYSEETHQDDVQQENCGNDTLSHTANNMKDDSMCNHDENPPTDTPPLKISKTKRSLMKSLSLGVLLTADSSNTSLLSLPGNINEPRCHLSMPVQEHGSTAVSAYAIDSFISLTFDSSLNIEYPEDTNHMRYDSSVLSV